MSSHPLTRHAATLQGYATHVVEDLPDMAEKAEVFLGGMVTGLQLKTVSKSRSGLTRMGKLTFEDLTGTVPAMLWPEEFAKNEPFLKDDAIVFVKGTLDRRRDPAELIISKVIPIERAAAELSRMVVVTLRKGIHAPEQVEQLYRKVRIRPGNLDLYLEILGVGRIRRAVYKAGQNLKLRHDDRLIAELEETVGVGNVRLIGAGGASGRPRKPAARPSPRRRTTPRSPDRTRTLALRHGPSARAPPAGPGPARFAHRIPVREGRAGDRPRTSPSLHEAHICPTTPPGMLRESSSCCRGVVHGRRPRPGGLCPGVSSRPAALPVPP